jgi:hypothetical protein
MSPVPGGRSIRQVVQVAPHRVCRATAVSADVAIGPRQIIGESSSIIRPIDIASIPSAPHRHDLLCLRAVRAPLRPSIVGMLGP